MEALSLLCWPEGIFLLTPLKSSLGLTQIQVLSFDRSKQNKKKQTKQKQKNALTHIISLIPLLHTFVLARLAVPAQLLQRSQASFDINGTARLCTVLLSNSCVAGSLAPLIQTVAKL